MLKFIVYLFVYVYINAFPAYLCWKYKTLKEIAKIEGNKSAYIICSATYYGCIVLIVIYHILFIGGLIRGR